MTSYIIPDDSGIIAIVNPEIYESFVHSDWSLEQLLTHFNNQMANRSLLIWSTGAEGNWRVAISFGSSGAVGFRNIRGSIRVGSVGLYLTSYDSLTMAAQFPDEKIPQPHENDFHVPIKPGLVDLNVIQMFDPEDAQSENVFYQETPHFVVELTDSQQLIEPWQNIPWLIL